MSYLENSKMDNSELPLVSSRDEQLSQATIVSMYGLPDVISIAASEPDSRARPWLLKEGGARSAFLEARESRADSHASSSAITMLRTLREQGLAAAVRQWLENVRRGGDDTSWARSLAVLAKGVSCVLSGARWTNSLFSKLYPHHTLPPEEIVKRFVSCGDAWSETKVRAFDWHPHTLKLAIATIDDAVRVFYGASSDKPLAPTLKHPRQKNVADLKWRPFSASSLGVAAQDGVVLWTVDPNSLSARPSSSCVSFFTLPGHRPVTTLAWTGDGKMLFSGSPCDGRVVAWDVAREGTPTPLSSISGGGISHLSFSPSGRFLLSATPSSEFRVWDTASTWTNERWTRLNGRLRTAAWSPDGGVLLFAADREAVVYALDFRSDGGKNGGDDDQNARPVLNLNSMELDMTSEDTVFAGGSIHQIAWDSSGERVAIALQPQSGHSGVVVLLTTRVRAGAAGGSANVEFFHSGVIRGTTDESYATRISFCPTFPPGSEPPWSPGALLAVVWAKTGRVSYHPIHFIPESGKASSSTVRTTAFLATSRLESSQIAAPNPSLVNASFGALNSSLMGDGSFRREMPLFSSPL